MYVLENALKNLGRNKGRNILLGCIIFAIILSIAVSLIINTTSKAIINDYKDRFGSKVSFTPDIEKIMKVDSKKDQEGPVALEFPVITSKQYIEFAKSPYLKSYSLEGQYGSAGVNVKAIDEDVKNDNAGIGIMIDGTNGAGYQLEPKLNIIGNSSIDNLKDFIDGTRKIIEGSIYQKKGECVVSSEFAKINNLSIGSMLEFKNATVEGKTFKLKLVGIYADTSKAYENDMFKMSFVNRRNEVLTSMDSLFGAVGAENVYVQANYLLKSPDDLKAFEKELRAKGLDLLYLVTTDKASYDKIVAPVLGLSQISFAFMIVVLILGGIILLILTSIAIRERKYEIGVLRAMGMKKGKVALMLVSEMIAITFICLIVGVAVGSVISQPVADVMLKTQIEATQNVNDISGQFGDTGTGTVIIGGDSSSIGNEQAKPLSEIEISLMPTTIMQISLIALIIAFLSSIAGVLYISKYEPIKILSERD